MKYPCNHIPTRGWPACDNDALWEVTWAARSTRYTSRICHGHLADKLRDINALDGVSVFTVRRLQAVA